MEKLKRLEIDEQGFVFDPRTGESFTINPMGRHLLNALQLGLGEQDIIESLTESFVVEWSRAVRDWFDFQSRLKVFGLV